MALSESELLKRVADAGRSVDSRRLRRWRDAGVVPSPSHLHDRGRPGSRTEYEEARRETLAGTTKLVLFGLAARQIAPDLAPAIVENARNAQAHRAPRS